MRIENIIFWHSNVVFFFFLANNCLFNEVYSEIVSFFFKKKFKIINCGCLLQYNSKKVRINNIFRYDLKRKGVESFFF